MHPPHLREQAFELRAQGVTFGQICRDLRLSRSTVGHWFYGDRARRRAERDLEPQRCPRCDRPPRPPDDQAAYAYLLGQYLGDGHLLTTQRVPLLTVACDVRYPGLIHEVSYAMEACGARTVGFWEQTGCMVVKAHWTHWPCLLPQHGPGMKHLRKITLTPWQQEIVDGNHQRFLRGLFHSDGCRITNRIRRGDKTYSYPRYHFTNESRDIMGLCQASLDQLGVAWRMCRPNNLSVARREAVARLDEFVGPKW